MLLYLSDDIISNLGSLSGDAEVFVWMILVPMIWILRAVAILGYTAPLIKSLGYSMKTTHLYTKVTFLVFWILFNIFFLFLSDITWYWRWIWLDVLGLFIGFYEFIVWNNKTLRIQMRKKIRREFLRYHITKQN